MSGKYHKVYSRTWTGQGFRSWSDDAKLASFYVRTCPHRNTEGLFRLPLPLAQHELGWDEQRTSAAFAELEAVGVIATDPEVDLVWLIDALEDDQPKGPKQLQGAVNHLAEIPDSPLRGRYLERCQGLCPELAEALQTKLGWRPTNPIDTLSKPYRDGIEGASEDYSGTPDTTIEPIPEADSGVPDINPGQSPDQIPLRNPIDTPSIAQAPARAPSQAPPPPPTARPETPADDLTPVVVAVADEMVTRAGYPDQPAKPDLIELVGRARGRGWPTQDLLDAGTDVGAKDPAEIEKTALHVLRGAAKRMATNDPPPERAERPTPEPKIDLDFSDLTGLPADPADEITQRYADEETRS